MLNFRCAFCQLRFASFVWADPPPPTPLTSLNRVGEDVNPGGHRHGGFAVFSSELCYSVDTRTRPVGRKLTDQNVSWKQEMMIFFNGPVTLKDLGNTSQQNLKPLWSKILGPLTINGQIMHMLQDGIESICRYEPKSSGKNGYSIHIRGRIHVWCCLFTSFF